MLESSFVALLGNPVAVIGVLSDGTEVGRELVLAVAPLVLSVGADDVGVRDETTVEPVDPEAVDELTGVVDAVEIIVDPEVELVPVAVVGVDIGKVVPVVALEAVVLLII